MREKIADINGERERERRKCEKAKGLPITSAVSEIYSRSLLK